MTRLPALTALKAIGIAAMIMVAAGLGRQGGESPPSGRIAMAAQESTAVEPAAFVSYAGGAETIEALFH